MDQKETIDRWQIDRRVRNGRTVFWFEYGGDLDVFDLVEKVIVEQLGGKVRGRLSGPCGENLVTLEVADHVIKLCNDCSDLLWFLPADDRDVELTQAFALKLKKLLAEIPKPRPKNR